MRTIIFGDIHGCHKEWEALLEKLNVTDDDRLISVGDLVNKGPSTPKTLDLAMSLPNLQCVIGNHDLALLNHWKTGKTHKPLTTDQKQALADMAPKLDAYMAYIDAWPAYLEFEDFIVVHAGIMPGVPLNEQQLRHLVTLRTLPPDNRPWYQDYTDDKLIVHGHWAAQGVVVRDNVIGLDSGCVYGKELTALVLPERALVNVTAEKVYCPID